DAHDVRVDRLRVDHAGAAELLLEVGDLLLEHRLLVLGVVVLSVLGDVPELARLLDALGHLAAAVAAEEIDLGLELLEAFRCKNGLSCHKKNPRLSLRREPRSVAIPYTAEKTLLIKFRSSPRAFWGGVPPRGSRVRGCLDRCSGPRSCRRSGSRRSRGTRPPEPSSRYRPTAGGRRAGSALGS